MSRLPMRSLSILDILAIFAQIKPLQSLENEIFNSVLSHCDLEVKEKILSNNNGGNKDRGGSSIDPVNSGGNTINAANISRVSSSKDYIVNQVVLWLLKVDLLQQPDTYIQLLSLYSNNAITSIRGQRYRNQRGDSQNTLDTGGFYKSQSHLFDYVATITKDEQLLELFRRLAIYFNGEYSLRDILWNEQLTMDQIDPLLITFRKILLCFQHVF